MLLNTHACLLIHNGFSIVEDQLSIAQTSIVSMHLICLRDISAYVMICIDTLSDMNSFESWLYRWSDTVGQAYFESIWWNQLKCGGPQIWSKYLYLGKPFGSTWNNIKDFCTIPGATNVQYFQK